MVYGCVWKSVGLMGLVVGVLPLLHVAAAYLDLSSDSFPDSIDSVDVDTKRGRETRQALKEKFCYMEKIRNFTKEDDWTEPGVNKAQCLTWLADFLGKRLYTPLAAQFFYFKLNWEAWLAESEMENNGKSPRPQALLADNCAEFHLLSPGDNYLVVNGIRIGHEYCRLIPPGPGSILTPANEPSFPSFTCKKLQLAQWTNDEDWKVLPSTTPASNWAHELVILGMKILWTDCKSVVLGATLLRWNLEENCSPMNREGCIEKKKWSNWSGSWNAFTEKLKIEPAMKTKILEKVAAYGFNKSCHLEPNLSKCGFKP